MPQEIERVCRHCGCDDESACVVDGITCGWHEDDLCTFCAAELGLLPSDCYDVPLVELGSEADLTRVVAEYRAMKMLTAGASA